MITYTVNVYNAILMGEPNPCSYFGEAKEKLKALFNPYIDVMVTLFVLPK